MLVPIVFGDEVYQWTVIYINPFGSQLDFTYFVFSLRDAISLKLMQCWTESLSILFFLFDSMELRRAELSIIKGISLQPDRGIQAFHSKAGLASPLCIIICA